MTSDPSGPTPLLDRKVISIVGASSGIGAEAARLFSREGATVVLGAWSERPLAELCDELNAAGGRATYRVCDIGKATDNVELVEHAVSEYGRLDGAFNNAGMGGSGYGRLADLEGDVR